MNSSQLLSFYRHNGFGHIDLENGRQIRSLPDFNQFGVMTLRIFDQAGVPSDTPIFQWHNLLSSLAESIDFKDFTQLVEHVD